MGASILPNSKPISGHSRRGTTRPNIFGTESRRVPQVREANLGLFPYTQDDRWPGVYRGTLVLCRNESQLNACKQASAWKNTC